MTQMEAPSINNALMNEKFKNGKLGFLKATDEGICGSA